MASIKLENVEKVYSNGQVAVRGLHLEVADGEFLVLVGPSGCGKSTVLRIVAGLESPTGGRVFLGERDVTRLPPQERDLAMVFQNYALYPHKTVRDNLAFALRLRRTKRGVVAERVERVARTLGLEGFLDRKPGQLSGGQRQRVALGRAIVREPKAFLLDEPLSNLDAQLRVQTRTELVRMHRQLRATMLYVTHDQEEAMTLGDRVAVLRDGLLQQLGPPLEIYLRPASVFVGGFIGAPAIRRQDGKIGLETPGCAFMLDSGTAFPPNREEILLGVRPSDIRLVDPAAADAVCRVDVIQPRGSELLVHLNLAPEAKAEVTMVAPSETKLQVNDRVGIRFLRDCLHLFDPENEERVHDRSSQS
jgi:multiple sugar transport system ATP-binding protein